jgi:hypothetical protein
LILLSTSTSSRLLTSKFTIHQPSHPSTLHRLRCWHSCKINWKQEVTWCIDTLNRYIEYSSSVSKHIDLFNIFPQYQSTSIYVSSLASQIFKIRHRMKNSEHKL